MDIDEFNRLVRENGRVEAGSEMHRFMHESAQRALKLTSEINSKYRSPEELRVLVSDLTGREVGEGF